jgi:hypothetical protein
MARDISTTAYRRTEFLADAPRTQARTSTRWSVAEGLAALAALAAAIASLAGFVPGLYRDPAVVISQSHGYDVGDLFVAVVLLFALTASARGSLRGRLIAIGALGCLLYSYITYAFLIILNPATVLYIAVLSLGGWSFVAGLADVDDRDAEALIAGPRARMAIAAFLLLVAFVFAVTWLRQIADSLLAGQLPLELRDAGWPMNPIWVLDLGFMLPLLAMTGIRLVTGRTGGARAAAPLMVFMALLGVTILAMVVSMGLDGQVVEPFMPALFAVIAVVSAVLAWLALSGRRAEEGSRNQGKSAPPATKG